jgi:peptide/nickel transport system substrate-binding protein
MRQLVFALALVVLLAGCATPVDPVAVSEPAVELATSEATAVTAPSVGGTLARAMTSEPASIDPQGAPSSGLSLVAPYLFDTLVVKDVDNSIHPLLAESWEISDDGLSITMKLRDGVVFQDGAPLDAQAVKLTFERFLEKGTRSPIYGGIAQIASITAVDDLTVQFTFDEPAANFWSTISMPYAGIVSPQSMATFDETGEGYLVGTGPFKLGEWQSGQSISLLRNEDYAWAADVVDNPAAPYLEELLFRVIPDSATQLAALEAGEVDVIFINQPSHKLQLEGADTVTLEEAVLNSLIYLGFNTQAAPFDEVKVRQALAHAVNKEDIVNVALGGLGLAAYAPLPPTLPGFDPSLKDYELGHDPEQARTLLREAGFEETSEGTWTRDGQDLEALLLTSTRPPNAAIATLLQSQLAAIGVPVEIQQLDGKAVMEATGEGKFDLLLWRYDWNDPDALNIFLGSDRIGRTNRVAYSNPDVDALLAQGAQELDETTRNQLYVDAQEIILLDAPWQPLYNPIDVMAMTERIQDVKIGYMGRMLVNDAYEVSSP